ncbi:deoxynucleoside kinase [Derxia gummosa]|uniref:Deoxynucleoside kinase n=1 Tax=Derxia gummosa DSM 723 TaxID=1121388 RepID=A0A8B6X810_9BURK|nr:deoxynucleoside kinase [Derxia gummosa]
MELAKLRRVVVEGPIGVGKTTLARRLADLIGADVLLETPETNPFLERFYRDAGRYALATQLSFLFQRLKQLADMEADLLQRPVVSDFLLDKDPLFARLTLEDDEFQLYRQVFDSLRAQAAPPDLVVYLQASPEALLARVNRRGIPMEAAITDGYLRALSDAYGNFFHHYDAAPLLMINTEHLNPVDSEDDFKLLISRIGSMRGQREFFNLAG